MPSAIEQALLQSAPKQPSEIEKALAEDAKVREAQLQSQPNITPAPEAVKPSAMQAALQESVRVDPSLDTMKDGQSWLDRAKSLISVDPLGKVMVATGEATAQATSSAIRTALDSVKFLKTTEDVIGHQIEKIPGVKEANTSLSEALPLDIFGAAAKVADKIDKELLPPAAAADAPFKDQLFEAAGSTAGIMLPGMAGANLLQKAAIATSMGVSVGAQQLYEDAKSHGATEDQAAIAYALGGFIGSWDGPAAAYFFNKIAKSTGVDIAKHILEQNANKVPSLLGDVAKGFLIEGGQEGIQQLAQNEVAKDIAGYDPNRSLGENFWMNFVTGGILGSGFGAAIHGMDSSEREAFKRAREEDFRRAMASGDPINFIEGAFTPVQEQVKLQQMLADVNERIQKAGEVPQDPNELIKSGGVRIDSNQGYLGEDLDTTPLSHTYFEHLLSMRVHPVVEKLLENKDTKQNPSVLEALEQTPVVVTASFRFKDEITLSENFIKTLEEQKKEALLRLTTGITPEEAAGVKSEIEGLTKALKLQKEADLELRKNLAMNNRILAELKGVTSQFREIFAPNTKVVIIDYQADPLSRGQEEQDTRNGEIAITFNALRNSPSGPTTVATMYVNTDKMLANLKYRQNTGDTNATVRMKQRLYEIVTHELGHLVHITAMRDLKEKAFSGDPVKMKEAQGVLNALVKDHKEFLKVGASAKILQHLENLMPPERAQEVLTPGEGIEPDLHAAFLKKSYFYSFDEFFADTTARLATQGRLGSEILTKFFKPIMERYQKLYDALPETGKMHFGGSWQKFMESKLLSYKIKKEIEKSIAGGGKDIISALQGLVPGFDPKNFAGLREDLDYWNKGVALGLNLLQMSKEFSHIPHWKNYLNAMVAWQAYQRNFAADLEGTMVAIRDLGKIERAQLSEVLFSESENKKVFPNAVLSSRLSGEALQVYKDIRGQLKRVLDEMRAISLKDAADTHTGTSEDLKLALDEINKEFDKMGSKGYFPFLRFGKYTLTATANQTLMFEGEEYKKGQTITFPTFETEKERNQVAAKLREQLGTTATVGTRVMGETEFQIQGMPKSILTALERKLIASNSMTPEIQEAFDKTKKEVSPFKTFRKQFLRRKGIEGYSRDMERALAYYIRSAAGHLARVKYASAMLEPIRGMQDDVKVIAAVGHRADDRQKMHDWMQKHLSYVLNPANELAALRGVGFVAFLGFNVKSALVNSIQPFTTTLPYLSARYGTNESVKAMGRATFVLKDWITKKKDFIEETKKFEKVLSDKQLLRKNKKKIIHPTTEQEVVKELEKGGRLYYFVEEDDFLAADLVPVTLPEFYGLSQNPRLPTHAVEPTKTREPGHHINLDTLMILPGSALEKVASKKVRYTQLFARGMHEGWIDQSLATELAIAASQDNLNKSWYLTGPEKFWHTFSRYSALPFHLVEKMNRYITSVAAYDLEYAKSENHEKAIQAAKMANYSTNYENARWNRPEFMRGKKSVFFLFGNYLQNTLYFATRDPGAVKWWITMLLLAGALGLPMADDAIELADYLGTYFKRILGMKNPKVELRAELRKNLEELHMNPDLILHGISQNSFGLGQIGELTGIPIPQFDLSSSIGMGRVIPGVGLLGRAQTAGEAPALGDIALSGAGAAGNMVEQFYNALFSKNPDEWKRMEQLVPMMALRNVSKSLRYATRGGEFTSAGDKVADFSQMDMRTKLELVGQGLGFSPTAVGVGWEKVLAEKDMVQYYKTQASALQAQFNWSVLQEDREARAEVMKSVREYNAQVPYPEMGLKPKDMKEAAKQYIKEHLKKGSGLAEKKYYRITKDLETIYQPPALGTESTGGDGPP